MMSPAKRTKYRGVWYRSGFEAEVAMQLHLEKLTVAYEMAELWYTTEHVYMPDFVIAGPSGPIYIETKGYFPVADRSKMLAVQRAHPEADIRIVFQRAHTKLSRAKKSLTYGTWATRRGFLWAESTIPQAWLDEIRGT